MKSFVVTGANKGIGLAVVRRILLDIPESFVFLGSRNKERGEKALKALTDEDSNFSGRLELLQLDTSNILSVESAFASIETFLKLNPDKAPLYGLVNNAGIGGDCSAKEVFDVNVRGLYHATKTFLSLMSETGRIVNVSSGAAPSFVQKCNEEYIKYFTNEKVLWSELDDLMRKISAETDSEEEESAKWKSMGLEDDDIKGKGWYNAYSLSKALCNSVTMLFARENPQMKINCCTPGFVLTDLTVTAFADNDVDKAKKMGMITPDEGTKAIMKLLTEDLKGNGFYYGSDGKRSPMHKYRSPGDPEYEG